MSKNQITLGIRSPEGRKRLQVSSTATATTLKSQIKALLNTDEDFVVKKDKNGRPGEEVKFARTSTITSLRLKSGDVLFVSPKAGTRFIVDDGHDENNGSTSMSTSGSSASLASINSTTVAAVPVNVEVRSKLLNKNNLVFVF